MGQAGPRSESQFEFCKAGVAKATIPSNRESVRPISSTNEGGQDIAGRGGSGQAATEEGIAVGDEVEVDEEEVTARDPKVARRPIKPTQAMILAHELHHADYRDWCDNCRGRQRRLTQA